MNHNFISINRDDIRINTSENLRNSLKIIAEDDFERAEEILGTIFQEAILSHFMQLRASLLSIEDSIEDGVNAAAFIITIAGDIITEVLTQSSLTNNALREFLEELTIDIINKVEK